MQEISTEQQPPQTSQQTYEPTQEAFTPYVNPYSDIPPYSDVPLPPPPPLQKPPRSRKRLLFIIGIVVAILVLGTVVGSIAAMLGPKAATPSTTQTTQKVTTSPTQPSVTTQPTQPPATQVPQSNTIGKPYDAAGYDWIVTINNVHTSHGNEYMAPKAGSRFVVVNVTVQNTDATTRQMLVAMFSVRDADGQPYAFAYDPTAKEMPQGNVPAGGKITGEMVFEIPDEQTHLTILFSPTFGASDVAVWQVTVK